MKHAREFSVLLAHEQRVITADYTATRDGRIAFYLNRPAATPDFLVISFRSIDVTSFQEIDPQGDTP